MICIVIYIYDEYDTRENIVGIYVLTHTHIR